MDTVQKAINAIDQLQGQRKYQAALEMARREVQAHKGSRPLALKLAELLEICKEFTQAAALYRNVHEAIQAEGGSSDISILLGLANCLYRSSEYAQATKLYDDLYGKVSNHPDVLAGKAALARHHKDYEAASKYAKEALSIDKHHKSATFELAEVLIHAGEEDAAVKVLESNLRRKDVHGDSIDLWMGTLSKLNRDRYAQDTLEELSKTYPDIVEFVYGFGVLANRAGEITLARPAFENAMNLSPNNPRIIYELGVLERIAGNIKRSNELIEKALVLQPDNPAALRTFGADIKYEYGDDNYKRLNYVAAKFSEFSPVEQIHLHYALAKVGEDVGELDAAFRHYAVAGAKKRKIEHYNERDAAKLSQVIPKVVTPENLKKANEIGSQSDVPVFILGMPRSGTSLMEQILSAHPDIFGAGELKILTGVLENIGLGENKGLRLRMGEKDPVFDYDANVSWAERGDKYVERLKKLADGDYKRIVDKMPGNCNFVGLIHAILPNAKIIHSRRHPVETCLSCYRIHFAEGHFWTYNLRELGRHYRRYWDLMKYWREAFPGVMYEAIYEENVADTEGSARKLIDYLGLDWNERCLEFYNVDRPVKTASVTQVRKPIYKTSTNRWRKYEKHLGPLLDEIGDIVEAYEAEIAHLIEK